MCSEGNVHEVHMPRDAITWDDVLGRPVVLADVLETERER